VLNAIRSLIELALSVMCVRAFAKAAVRCQKLHKLSVTALASATVCNAALFVHVHVVSTCLDLRGTVLFRLFT